MGHIGHLRVYFYLWPQWLFFKPKILVFILLQLRVGHIHTLTCSSFSFPKNFPRIVLNDLLYPDSYSLYITATQWPFYDFLKFCIILFFSYFFTDGMIFFSVSHITKMAKQLPKSNDLKCHGCNLDTIFQKRRQLQMFSLI